MTQTIPGGLLPMLPPPPGAKAAGFPKLTKASIDNLKAYGGIKGGSLAFMIEVLATLGGARFGFEDESGKTPGAVTSNAGQFLLLIEPRRFGDGFLDRIEALIEQLREAGTGRLPGDLRYERRRIAERDGIEVTPEMHAYLKRKGQHVVSIYSVFSLRPLRSLR